MYKAYGFKEVFYKHHSTVTFIFSFIWQCEARKHGSVAVTHLRRRLNVYRQNLSDIYL